jgi:8-oxo-dGTP diphosphatase
VKVTSNVIRIAAAVISDSQGRLLLVRKRGTTAFMQAGGKIDEGEAPAQALIRELAEELNLFVDADALVSLGIFEATAANEPDHLVSAQLFALTSDSEMKPCAEIEDVVWVKVDEARLLALAPLTREHVLSLHREKLGNTGKDRKI